MQICRGSCWGHPDEMLAQLRWDQVLDWLAFYESDPWGPQRDDLRSGVHAALMLSPYSEQEPPNVTWPYTEDDAEPFDPAAGLATLRDHRARFGYGNPPGTN